MSRTALLSVYNKAGIVEFARELLALDFSLLASGGTAKALVDEGLPVQDIATLVGEPLLGHRVVTLSREIHAGLLAKDTPEDRAELAKRNIPFIDLVCVDLYPLLDEIKKVGATPESVLEKTDIGGPTMLRSAAKGRRIVISQPADRPVIISWLKNGEPNRQEMLKTMASHAEKDVALYCLISACYTLPEYSAHRAYRELNGEFFPGSPWH